MRWAVLLLAACGSSSAVAPMPDAGGAPDAGVAAALGRTLDDLAAFGNKHAGTPADAAAATYVAGRLGGAGLAGVHVESFHFPRHDVTGGSFAVTVGGAPRSVAFEVLEACGAGHADAAVVHVGGATPADLAGIDLKGKIALVDRLATYHRSTQYVNVGAAGAVAMIYISDAPEGLIQVGSVRRTFETAGPIPAISVGLDDGQALRANAHATIDVAVAATPATGQNLVGTIAGTLPDQIVIGAHYDTWFAGSTDNGGGVAALLELAGRRAHGPKPKHTLVFVAYDGEEVALYGGYDYMHHHHGVDPIAAVMNFEVPSADDATLLGLGRSNLPAFDAALTGAGLRGLYPIYVYMDSVPALFGGIIPTDIQGLYRAGVPTMSTAVSNPYYHTTKDTPDQVDLAFLAEVVEGFDAALTAVDGLDAAALAGSDPALWHAAARVSEGGGALDVGVDVTDAGGAAQANAIVIAALLEDDFFQVGQVQGTTDAKGHVELTLGSGTGQGGRYLHVTAGKTYPLVETVVALP